MTYYCLIDFLALMVLLITNNDIVLRDVRVVRNCGQRLYRLFLFAVIAYYISDFIWAWLYNIGTYPMALYVDTEVYFIFMALGTVLWSRFVIKYLRIKRAFARFLNMAAVLLFMLVIIATPLNRMWDIMFWFDMDGIYHTGSARDFIFIYQVVLLLVLSLYTLFIASHIITKQKKRNIAVGLSGIVMLVFVAVQIFFPTYPLYAISNMMGCCLLRTFVVEHERDEYRENLKITLAREREQFEEFKKVWRLAYKDALTGVKNKLAYAEKCAQIDSQINKGTLQGMAVAVMDLNDLKVINDTFGHDVGDEYIKSACRLICEIFKKSPVYRIGGDEFAVILEGNDYEHRDMLLKTFDMEIEKNLKRKAVVIAIGMAEYNPEQDDCYKQVFERADVKMYQRKQDLKKIA